MIGRKAKCMIVCVGKEKKTKITVCIDRESGELSKTEESSLDCSEKVFDK